MIVFCHSHYFYSFVACYLTHIHALYVYFHVNTIIMQVTLQLVFVAFQRVGIISRLFLWAVAGDILHFLSHSSSDQN